MVELNNGNKIETSESPNNKTIRGKRSSLIGFVCDYCGQVSERAIEGWVFLQDDTVLHRECFEELKKLIEKEEEEI